MRYFTITVAAILLLLSCNRWEQEWNPHLIAHAGGSIAGNIYTNSHEALKKAIDSGYRHIEFDLQFTADSVLVTSHSWKDYNKLCGREEKGDSAPLLSEFVSQRILGKYTPLTAREINDYLTQYSDIILVTDKVSDPNILNKYFPNLKDRMIVEAFSYEHYTELRKQGYREVLYSCMADDLYSSVVKHILLHPLFKGEKIEWISLHTSALDNILFKIIDLTCNYKAALFTINDTADVPRRYRKNIKYIYTDSIQPGYIE